MAGKKRRRAWGSVTRVSRDKHVIRWVESTPEGRKRRSRTIHGTYAEACLELDRLHVLHADERACPTVGRAAELWWLPWVMSDAVSPKTRSSYLSAWEAHVRPRWGSTPLDAVHPMEVQAWLDGMTKGAAATALVVARRIGDLAVKYEACPSNKFRVAYDMPAAGRDARAGVLTLAQAAELLARMRGARAEAPFILSCFGGCRTGESLGVRADEVSIAERRGVPVAMVPIVRQMESEGELPVERLKNAQSRRVACVPGQYAERLAEIAAERLAEGCAWLADRGDGLPMNQHALLYDWRVDFGAPVEWRALRASWRTIAGMDWRVDYDAAELLMGHSLPGVTGRHYMRPSPDQLADELARAYGEWLRS